jgi:gliding motility-associated-like protein
MQLLRKTTLLARLLLLLLLPVSAGATHLVGGSISYTYLGQENGKDKYEILVSMYRDCTSQTQFDSQIMLGFYENTGRKPLTDSIEISINSVRYVNPPSGGSDCSFDPSVCLQEGLYKAIILLPASNYGYHVIHMRCCRNKMNNVPENEGFAYYAFIPPSSYKNSSPYFNEVPAPYVCIQDTLQLANTAKEPDGDSLVYRLTIPFSGGSADTPVPVLSKYFYTPYSVNYFPGFSYTKPFGSKGIADVNPQTGITTVFVPSIGRYVFAIQVEEYRNGQLIAVTRRDVQLIAENCPYNPSPVRRVVNGTKSSNISVTAGEKLNFDFGYSDPNNNPLDISVSGSALLANPAAIVTAGSSGSLADGHIDWQTSCDQAKAQPYAVVVKVQDKGCPPKTITDIIFITVKPFKGTSKLTGPQKVCYGSQPSTYNSSLTSGGKLLWFVTNGKIIEGGTGFEMAKVAWDNQAKGSIKVVEISPNGCPGDTNTLLVGIYPPPDPGKVSGPVAACVGDTLVYMVNKTTGSNYTWVADNGKLLKGNGTGTVTVVWQKPDSGKLRVVEENAIGCLSDTFVLKVRISAAKADTIVGPQSVCPYSKNIEYWVNKSQPGSKYLWFVSGGTQIGGGTGPLIAVDWDAEGTGLLKMVEITALGCAGDTATLIIQKEYNLVTPPIEGPEDVCEFNKGVVYSVLHSNGSTYDWKVSGGDIISGNGTSEIVVDWGTAATGYVSVTQTAWDSVNNRACIGRAIFRVVHIHPTPQTTGIFGPISVCAHDTLDFRVNGFDSSRFIWKLNGTDSFAGNSVADSIRLILDIPGTYLLEVTEISQYGCPGPSLQKQVIVHPIPQTTAIVGDSIVCAPNMRNKIYKVKGFQTSKFYWTIDGGEIVSGDSSPQVVVNWTQEGYRSISVQEVSEFGCPGAVQKLGVKVDSLFLTIDLVTTLPSNDKQIQVNWTRHNGTFLTGKLFIYRSVANGGSGYYILIDSVPNTATSYLDTKVETGEKSYYYKILAHNSCGTMVESPPHRSILLEGQMLTDSTISMVWNKYEGWPFGVSYYEMYRKVNNASDMSYLGNQNDTNFFLSVGLDGYRQCFRIAAVKAQQAEIVSWSNILCFNFEPYVFIPNIFTPDNNDLNETFKVFVHNYVSYRIDIYNRWGEHVFTSNDPEKNWDGTFKGNKCPEGVYVYLVTVQGSQKVIRQNGNFTLVR